MFAAIILLSTRSIAGSVAGLAYRDRVAHEAIRDPGAGMTRFAHELRHRFPARGTTVPAYPRTPVPVWRREGVAFVAKSCPGLHPAPMRRGQRARIPLVTDLAGRLIHESRIQVVPLCPARRMGHLVAAMTGDTLALHRARVATTAVCVAHRSHPRDYPNAGYDVGWPVNVAQIALRRGRRTIMALQAHRHGGDCRAPGIPIVADRVAPIAADAKLSEMGVAHIRTAACSATRIRAARVAADTPARRGPQRILRTRVGPAGNHVTDRHPRVLDREDGCAGGTGPPVALRAARRFMRRPLGDNRVDMARDASLVPLYPARAVPHGTKDSQQRDKRNTGLEGIRSAQRDLPHLRRSLSPHAR